MIIICKKSFLFLICGIISVLLIILMAFPAGLIQTISNSYYDGYTVVIDAGHGGRDGGCSGNDGTLEKDLNLDVAIKVADLFRLSGIDVILTRDIDKSTDESERFIKNLDIKNRIKLINSQKKPLLISIHMNKFSESKYKGAQFFFGRDEISKALANELQFNVKTYLQNDNNRKTKKIPSDVLLFRKITAPAILCECGFLSNPEDLENLKKDEYKSKFSIVIYTTVLKYILNK